jgi:hypothetical protein
MINVSQKKPVPYLVRVLINILGIILLLVVVTIKLTFSFLFSLTTDVNISHDFVDTALAGASKTFLKEKREPLFLMGGCCLYDNFWACFLYRFDLPNLLLRYDSFDVVIIVDIVLTETFLQKDTSFVEETEG